MLSFLPWPGLLVDRTLEAFRHSVLPNDGIAARRSRLSNERHHEDNGPLGEPSVFMVKRGFAEQSGWSTMYDNDHHE